MLLHGFPDSAVLWRHQIPVLVEADYRVIAPDQRGFGDSDAPTGKMHYTLDCLVADLLGIIDQLGIEKVSVVGHDWGAVMGWYLAMRYPERVQCFMALSVGHPAAYIRAGLEQVARAWYAVVFLFPGLAERLLPARNWFILRARMQDNPEIEHWIADLPRTGRLTAGLNWYRANAFGMLKQDFQAVKIPTLGVWSTDDFYVSEKQMLGSAAYVDADWRYERIPGAGHWIPLEAPGQLNALLLDFLKSKVS